ncbi:MAG: alkaline phosphatase, partial [Nitrospirae bacterium]|nr:alkaline phosphatase [Nitrospirota bacterium]
MINAKWSNMNKNKMQMILRSSINILLILVFILLMPGRADVFAGNAKYIILMVGDGWGQKAIEATNKYTGTTPPFQQTTQDNNPSTWTQHWVSTFPIGGSYSSAQAWSNFSYVMNNHGDSAACATALYTGSKTANGRVTVSSDASQRFESIAEIAQSYNKLVGAVSTVPVSHATPGGWVAHNDDRGNTFAIADEGLFGDPNTTGTPATDWKYGGGHGPSITADVLIGSDGAGYVSSQILTKLRNESGALGNPARDITKHFLVERQGGQNASAALMQAATDPYVTKLAGLFTHVYHNANDSGYSTENPRLSESTRAALKVLGKDPNGFVLMVEGGAIDWAAHANNMNQLVGEVKDFDDAIKEVTDWVEKTGYWTGSTNDSNWNNTLILVTGDHDCGYLTKGPGIFPNQPLGNVNDTTLAKEKIVSGTGGLRASWEDMDGDSLVDAGETVYWYWNSGDHTTSLIPLYARGTGSELIAQYETSTDSVRGPYIDDTQVFTVMNDALAAQSCNETGYISVLPGQSLYGNPLDITSSAATSDATNVTYTVKVTTGCDVDPNGSFINAENFSGTINQGSGYWSISTSNPGYFGTGHLRSDYGSGGSCPAVDQGKEYRVYFPTAGTYYIWLRNWSKSLSGDSAFVGIDGNCAGSISESDSSGQTWNQWKWTKKMWTGSTPIPNTISVPTPGFHTVNVWVRENDYRLDGIYLTQGTETPTDASHGIDVNPASCNTTTIFTGSEAQATSINTTGWTNGLKDIEIAGDDTQCLNPLATASGTFTFNSTVPNADSLIISANTAIASIDPMEGDAGIVMQRFKVDSNNVQNGQVGLTSLTLSDEGTTASILDAKIYISTTSSGSLPADAVLIGNTGLWDGKAMAITLSGGTAADRTVTNGTSKYIYIVYDTAPGQADTTILSRVSSVFVAAPDLNVGNVGTSNLLNIYACVKTGSISMVPGQILNGNPANLTSLVNTNNATNLIYTVTEDKYCDVSPTGTFIQAENFNSTIVQGSGTFSLESYGSGYLGAGFIESHKTGTAKSTCPAIDEGKEYRVNFTTTGTYYVWLRVYNWSESNDSAFFGLDGACIGALSPSDAVNINRWLWSKRAWTGSTEFPATINVTSPGVHTINLWVRETLYMIDGIYLTKGTETPNDNSHGIEIGAICPTTLFSGTEAQAQSVNTTTWTNGEKKIQVSGDDATCLTHITPEDGTFTYDRNHRPTSTITDPLDGATLTSGSPDPYVIRGTANDDESVNHVEVSTDGGATWNVADCPGCAGASVDWTYSWALPANGNYTILSKAIDNRDVSEISGPSLNVTIYRGGPSISSTIPTNGATAVVADSTVTVNWDRNIDCSTVTNTSVSISPAPASWTKTSCSGTQAVFTPVGQAELTTYTLTVSTSVQDTVGNPMAAQYQFAYTTGESSAPSSAISDPLNGSKINSSAPNPYVITGMASDNNLVQQIEVSTNGGSTWNLAACNGCPGSNVSWTYNWALPADGTYLIKVRATDTSNNVEIPGAGNTVTVDRTSPSVSNTTPVNGSTAVVLNQNISITWNTNVDCSTVNTSNITSDSPGWTLFGCSGNTAFFTTSGQSEYVLYTVTVTTAVKNSVQVPMSDPYQFSYRTNKKPVLAILQPDGVNDSLKAGEPYNVAYNLDDPDHNVTAAFYYDTDNAGYDGTAISGACAAVSENAGATCVWDTTGMNSAGMPPQTFYIYGITNDGQGEVKSYSVGQITIYPPNVPPALSVSEPNGTDDTAVAGDTYNINYNLTDQNVDDTVTAAFYYDSDNVGYNGTAITGPCAAATEGTGITCAWNTAGMTPGSYYIYGITGDSGGTVNAYSPGQITINAFNTLPSFNIIEPNGTADVFRPGAPLNIVYNLNDPDEVVTARFYYDTDTEPLNPPGLTGITECQSAPEGPGSICTWSNTASITPGMYYIYGKVQDRTGATVDGYSGPFMIDVTLPSSAITIPSNGVLINSSASDPYTVNGTASDNSGVQGVEVSVNGGAWTSASCTGCGTGSANWTYDWSLPSDGIYTIQSRSTDVAGNLEIQGAGNTVTIDRTAPAVNSTVPANGAVGIAIDGNVTITWSENVNCSTVSTANITSTSPGWTLSSCSNNQAVFTTSGQADSTAYQVNITTAVTDIAGNPMSSAYPFSYTTNVPPALSISDPNGTDGTQTIGNPYTIIYSLTDPDNTVTAALYYDTDNSGLGGTAIPGCASVSEGMNAECIMDTAGMTPGTYYIYGVTGDGSGGSACVTRIWDGEGTDNLASNADNWSDNTAPQTGEDVVFNGTSTKACDWNIPVELLSLSLNSGYSGTVSINSPLTINGDLIVSDGTLIQNANVTLSGQGGSCTPQGGSQISAYSAGSMTIGNAGITVTPTSGLVTTEAGGTATFTVALNTEPTADVTIALGSLDTGEGIVSPASLTFTPADWNGLKTVTVTGQDDAILDGSVNYSIIIDSAISADLNYNGINPDDVSIINTDNESPAVSIAATTNGAEDAVNPTNGVFTVSLSTVSATDTVVSYTVDGTAAADNDYTALSGQVTILANTPSATITVPVTDDLVLEGNETVVVTITGTDNPSITLGAPINATVNISDDEHPVVSIAATTNGAEPATDGAFTVSLSTISATDTVVSYTVDGTAAAGNDYTALSGQVTVLANTPSATITVPVTDDLVLEGAETVVVTVTGTDNPSINVGASSSDTVNITDNETTSAVSIAATTNGAEPSLNGQFTVSLSTVSATDTVVSYTVGGSASAGNDYTALSGQVTIPANTSSATITLPVIDELIPEGTETVIVTLTVTDNLTITIGVSGSAAGNITDNDNALVSVTATIQAEEPATNGRFTVSLDKATDTDTVVSYAVGGTAAAGTDYTALSGQVTIPANQLSALIDVSVIDDSILEGTETLVLTLTGTNNASITPGVPSSDTLNITDNDNASVMVEDVSATEGGNLVFTVTLNNAVSGAFDVNVSFTNVTANGGGVDYNSTGKVLNFAGTAGETKQFTVATTDDVLFEGAETFTVNLSATNALVNAGDTATASIVDNESATVSIAATINGAEPATNGRFTVTLSSYCPQSINVNYSVSGTAAAGTDYTALSGTVTIPAYTLSRTINVAVINDSILEGAETVVAELTGTNNGAITVGSPKIATVNINDNESASVTVSDVSIAEGGNLVFTVSLNNAVAGPFDVNVGFSNVTATGGIDYDNTAQVLHFDGTIGETRQFTVTTTDDPILEQSETFTVTLTATNELVTDSDTAIGTITDNDTTTASISATTNGAEPATNGVFTVSLSTESATDTVVSYTVGGTAANGTDYTVVVTLTGTNNGAISIAVSPNNTATIDIADDDTSSEVSISATNNGAEPATNGVFTVSLTKASVTDTVVNYEVSGTGAAGSDYAVLSGTVTIPANASSVTITVSVIDDLVLEGNETVVVNITGTNNVAISVGAANNATVNILDNETASEVSIAVTTDGAEPATNGVFTVSLSTVSATDTVVDYTVGGTAADGSDYAVLSGTVTIPANASSATITVPVIDDLVLEGNETVVVNITGTNNVAINVGASDTATVNIIDNETGAEASISATTNGAEPATNGVFTVSLSTESATDTVVSYTVGGTAANGTDYT